MSTNNGVYSVVPSTQNQSSQLDSTVPESAILTPVAGSPTNVIQISGSNGQVYYATPNQIYSYISGTQNSALVIPSSQGNLLSLSQASSNGTLYYGTDTGYVGELNNPAGKQINQITGTGGILSIGCISNGSCNSGMQGIMALTSNTLGQSLPYFESTMPAQEYATSFYYYNLGSWVQPTYSSVINQAVSTSYYTNINNPGIQGSGATYAATGAQLPEFVTSVTFNGGNVYVGTNLFNIYAAKNYSCNNGSFKNGGCPLTFTGPINSAPLGWVQTSTDGTSVNNGSVGIIGLSVQTNGQLLAIAQESATYAIAYVSGANTY